MEAPPPPPGAQAGTPLRRDGFGQRTSGVGLQRTACAGPAFPDGLETSPCASAGKGAEERGGQGRRLGRSRWIPRPEGRSRGARAGLSLCPEQGILGRGPGCSRSRRDPVGDSEFGERGRAASGAGEARYSSGSRGLDEQLPGGGGTRRPPLHAFVRSGRLPSMSPVQPRLALPQRACQPSTDGPRRCGRPARLLPETGQPGASGQAQPRPAYQGRARGCRSCRASSKRRASFRGRGVREGPARSVSAPRARTAPRRRQEGASLAGRARRSVAGRGARAGHGPGFPPRWGHGKRSRTARRPSRRSLRRQAKRAPLGRDSGRERGDLTQNSGKTRRQPGSAKATLNLRRGSCFRAGLWRSGPSFYLEAFPPLAPPGQFTQMAPDRPGSLRAPLGAPGQ